ncbi:a-factor receptor [Serendipita sp. 405]|nr:a-factor receptor [Serendipita sp. 398]KAG8772043.1 a-factor receptor [Serendipita sp. 397]KAG8805857.1 a-factor receptor [Serendipita sp. 400]KAG8838853.1 a-factor receptor [Serendipita sp. 405]
MGIEQTPAALGFSPLFPAVPILCFLSFLCCMLLLPGIVKTRIFALIFYVAWLCLGSLIIGVNMCIWRNRTFDAPIYGDIVARIIHVYPLTLYLSIFCFGKFTWNITRPSSSLKVIDKRRRYNYIDAFLCVGIPLLWSPLLMTATRGRYMIVEDVGPVPNDEPSLQSFLTQTVPLGLITAASVYHSLLTASNIWRARRSGSTLDVTGLGASERTPYRKLSNLQALRYFALVTVHLVGMPFGFLWALMPLIIHRHELLDDAGRPWYLVFSVRENMRQLPLVYTFHREQMALWVNFGGFLFAIPINGILFFLLFGLGSDILGIYCVWLNSLRSRISGTVSSIQRFSANILWPTREPSSPNVLGHVTPFQPDDIALASYPSPVRKTAKGHLAQSELVPPPTAIQLLSPTSPPHGYPTMDPVSPVSPLERSRTFRKEPIPVRPLPVNRSSSDGSPRNASSMLDHKDYTNHSRSDCPPPYEPAGEGPAPSGSSRNSRTL